MPEDATVRNYRAAAQQGDATAQFNLGCAYANGRGVDKDYAQALSWHRKAAAQGHSGAQNNVGWMYDSGHGVTKNVEEAAKWYLQAAKNGSAVAQNNIGLKYEKGTGVPQSREEALRWFRTAADQGNENAKKNLARLAATPPPVTKESPKHNIRARERKTHDPQCKPLLAASTPTVYRHNAFRITGLTVDATPREIKRRIDDLKAAEEMGDADDEHSHAFALDPLPSVEHIREAAQRLNDPEKRIIEEFFWFWPEKWGNGKRDPVLRALLNGDTDTAFSTWNAAVSDDHSPASTVAKHNLAVMYQLVALDSEQYALEGDLEDDQQETLTKYWRTCFNWWEELTEDEAFWSLLTDRIRMLDDPRLTTGFARRMRETLPEALDKINAMLAIAFIERGKHRLAEQHVTYMHETHQGQDNVAGTMALVTKPLLNRLRTSIDHAEKSSKGSAASAHRAATNLLQMAAEPVRILQRFLPADDPQLTDTCDAIANTCLHCHQTMIHKAEGNQSLWDQAIAMLKQAIPFASSKEIKEELQDAQKDAARGKQLAHPKVKQITSLVQRAMSESQRTQLKTLGQEVAAALTALYNEVGGSSEAYRISVDLVAAALRGRSVELINRGQEQLSKVLEVLGNEHQRRMLAIMAHAGDSTATQFEQRKWDCFIDVAIGIDLYDRGKELAYSPELKKQFQNDAEALITLRDLCRQVASDLYSKRNSRGLLFIWGSERPTPPPSTSSTSSSSSSSVCFVATAVYGSYDHPAVRVLRYYRDETLMCSAVGRALVALYYRIGPSLAIAVRRNHIAVAAVRRILDALVLRITKSRQYRLFALQHPQKGAYDKEA